MPLEMLNEALEYLKDLLAPYGARAETFLLDKTEIKSFTIGYNLWDESTGNWTFSTEGLLPRLQSAVLKVREPSS